MNEESTKINLPVSPPNNTNPVSICDTMELTKRLETEIDRNIISTKNIGIVVFFLCLAATLYLFNDIKTSIDTHLALFGIGAKNKDIITIYPTQACAILIFRYAALATIATTIFIVGLKMAVACFDQSTRFTKRKLSHIFLQFLYKTHMPQMVDKVTLPELMAAFGKWTENIESAFSRVIVEKQEINTPKS